MILDDFKEALEGIDPIVMYGSAEKFDRSLPWDYIVFSRRFLSPNASKTGLADTIDVAIVREEFVPDGLPERVIDALTAIKGVKAKSEDWRYDYTFKPGTRDTVEVLVLSFVRARKRDLNA